MQPTNYPTPYPTGCAGFATYCDWLVAQAPSRRWFILALARDCANIDLAGIVRPRAFWRSLRTRPPLTFGPAGFRPELVDDSEPARHYAAFVFVGYWLPRPLARLFCRLWEGAQGIVYGAHSPADVALGLLAAGHGGTVRAAGPAALPALLRAELCSDC